MKVPYFFRLLMFLSTVRQSFGWVTNNTLPINSTNELVVGNSSLENPMSTLYSDMSLYHGFSTEDITNSLKMIHEKEDGHYRHHPFFLDRIEMFRPQNSQEPISIRDILSQSRVIDQNGDKLGLVVTGLNNFYGKWQYSIDGGNKYDDLKGQPSDENGIAFNRDAFLRYLPDEENYYGYSDRIEFKVFDGKIEDGTSHVNTLENTSEYSFTPTSETLLLTITRNPPISPFNPSTPLTLKIPLETEEDMFSALNKGIKISDFVRQSMITNNYFDEGVGIAVSLLQGAHPHPSSQNGKWQYSVNGTNWIDFDTNLKPTDPPGYELILGDDAWVRFSPKKRFLSRRWTT